MEELPFVSVIIPVYNDSVRLLKCLKALYLQTYPYNSYEVIVVDNNSIENVFSVCQQFPNVRYLQENKQGSYAARNCGVRAARGEIIACTDADCLPAHDWISSGVQSLLSNPDAGIVAGHIEMSYLHSQPNPIEYADRLMHLNQQLYAEKGYAATGNAFTWEWMFEKVGMFNEGLLSLGDREWGERVTGQGYGVVYSKEAYVLHPARHTLHALLRKVRFQARHKPLLKPWTWKDLFRQLLPMGWSFYWNLVGDRNLPALGAKFRFLLVVYAVKYIVFWEMMTYFPKLDKSGYPEILKINTRAALDIYYLNKS